jgi:hypothetical protein
MKHILTLLLVIICTSVRAEDAELVFGKVLQKLESGILVNCEADTGGVSAGTHAADNGSYTFEPGVGLIPSRAKNIVYVVGHPKFTDLADEDVVIVLVKRKGTFKYASVSGAQKTVAAYEALPKK